VAARNAVAGNKGTQFNSGGIVVLSAKQLTHGLIPREVPDPAGSAVLRPAGAGARLLRRSAVTSAATEARRLTLR
jgi:hypothetical protein